MLDAPSAAKDYLATAEQAWHAWLFTLTPRSGSPLYWTSADMDITSGGHTFLGNGAILSHPRYRQALIPEIDKLDIEMSGQFLLDDGRTVARAAVQGWFAGMRIEIQHLVMPTPGDLSLGAFVLFEGGVFETPLSGALVTTVTIASDAALLDRETIPHRPAQRECPYAVYEPATCGLDVADFTVTGSVSNAVAPTTRTITTGLTQADGYFNGGAIRFTSGACSGQVRTVRDFLHMNGAVRLSRPLGAAPAVGDAFSIYPGCDLRKATCKDRFANTAAFGAFPYMPLSESD